MSRGRVDERSPEEALTVSTPGKSEGPAAHREEQAFLPGARFGARFRIVELLGRGGMGEVYRADDLQLGQTVALKFLPRHLTSDEAALARLRNEVRIARLVSHPNVCRVFDIGEVDGRYFLSMEFVDGEDLASVLRRMGRPTREKAIEIAHQLCAGLAAAHESGVLHRDLKPANVMIDGRGRVRITDFGVASLARELGGVEAVGGTPAYMAPELLAGGGSTPRSDIYSLGLVLYEVFTGKPAFRASSLVELKELQLTSTPPDPSKLVHDLEPEVERMILRCLDRDPQARPANAGSLLATLPGGDPLTAALEAGDTPSPELVAAAGPAGVLEPAIGLACLAGIVVGLAVAALFAERTTMYGLVALDKPYAVLEEQAREIVRRLGYDEPAADWESGLNVHLPAWQYFARQDRSRARWETLSGPGQIGLTFLYRHSPTLLVPGNLNQRVTGEDPYPSEGNIALSMGLQGRLLRFEATPRFVDHSGEPHPPADWSVLFDAARLDMASFTPIRPRVRPRAYSDEQAAWQGVLPHRGDLPVRVEARALDGKPVFFETVTPYDPFWSAETAEATRAPPAKGVGQMLSVVLLTLVGAGSVFLASRNARRGRGDPKGAGRLAAFVFALRMLDWVVAGHHVPHLGAEFNMLIVALSGGLLLAALSWVLYMALEPYFRRLWPEALVSWTRLLAGRFRDPLVGRDILVGVAFGVGVCVIDSLGRISPTWAGYPPPMPTSTALDALRGGREAVGELFQAQLTSLAQALAIAMLFLLLRIVLRRQLLAAVAFCLVSAVIGGLQYAADPSGQMFYGNTIVGAMTGAAIAGITLTVLTRFGLLATVACFFVAFLPDFLPMSLDPAAPYFTTALLTVLIPVALAVYAFRASLGGRAVVTDPYLRP